MRSNRKTKPEPQRLNREGEDPPIMRLSPETAPSPYITKSSMQNRTTRDNSLPYRR